MSVLVFSDRQQLVLHLPSSGSLSFSSSPLHIFSPFLLALHLVEDDGEWLEELEGPTFRLLCSSYCHHTIVAVGEARDTSEQLQQLISFFLSCCRRLCGPGLLGLASHHSALNCLLHQWKVRGNSLAGVASLDVRLLTSESKKLFADKVKRWLDVRQRLKLPVHVVLFDNKAKILFASSSLSSHTILFMQLYIAARLDDHELADDGSLTDTHFDLPDEAHELLYLKLHDFAYTPCAVLISRTGKCVALSVVDLGDEQQRPLAVIARRCLAWRPRSQSKALVGDIQLNAKAFQKSSKLQQVSLEISRLSQELSNQLHNSSLCRIKCRQLLETSLQAFSTVTSLAFTSFKSSRTFPLCFLQLEPSLNLATPQAIRDLKAQNPSLLLLFVLNTTTGKSLTKKFDREGQQLLDGVVAELVETRRQLRKVVSLSVEVAGLPVYLLKLAVDREGRVQEEKIENGSSPEGLQRLEMVCLFQPGGLIDLGRLTLALASLSPLIHATLS